MKIEGKKGLEVGGTENELMTEKSHLPPWTLILISADDHVVINILEYLRNDQT